MERKDGHLKECSADIEIRFDSTAHSLPPFPFLVNETPGIADTLRSKIDSMIRDLIPTHQPLGVHIVPHTVTVREGSVSIVDSNERKTFSIKNQ